MADNYDSIIFDLDGTLFQTEKLAIPAFKNTFIKLKEDGYGIEKIPNDEEVISVIGNTLEDIWDRLLKGFPKEVHTKASEYLLKFELEGINDGYGCLYPGVVDTLIELKNNEFNLFIASNGLKKYILETTKAFKINYLFTNQYSVEDFNTHSKVELVRKIIFNNGIKKGIIVGDRISDVEAGIKNNLYVIGCSYGFSSKGELANSNIIIDDFTQIVDILKLKTIEKR